MILRIPTAAAFLLACIALLHAHSFTDTHSSSSSSVSACGPVLCVAAAHPATAGFDDEDASFGTPGAFDDDEESEAVAAAAAAAASQHAAASPASSKPPRTVVTDLDDDEVAELLADEDEFVGASGVLEEDAPPAARASGGKQHQTTTKKKKPAKSKKKSSVATAAGHSAEDASLSSAEEEPTIRNVVNAPKAFFHPFGIYEYLGLALIVLYIANFIYGNMRNARIARAWGRVLLPAMGEQFASVGGAVSVSGEDAATRASEVVATGVLEKDSPACYKLHASGRRYCESALLTLDLQPRQDLFGMILGALDLASTGNQDTLTLEIPMDDEAQPNFVFALLRKRIAKKLLKNEPCFTDIEHLTGPLATANSGGSKATSALDSKFALLSDLPLAEIEGDVLSERVVKALSKLPVMESALVYLLVSDQTTVPFSTSRKIIRCKLVLPAGGPDGESADAAESDPATATEAVRALTRFVWNLIDKMGEMKLSSAV